MILIKENESCPFSASCPYNHQNTCMGVNPNRGGEFSCDLVSSDGVFKENQNIRSPLDSTGKMVYLED